MDSTVARWVASTLSTLTLTSSKAWQIGRSSALLQTAVHRQGAGQRVFALFPGPSILAVTSATVALAVTGAEVICVSVVRRMAVSLVALAGVAMNVSPVTRGINVIAVTFSTHTGTSVAADFAIWGCAPPLAFPWADVTLKLTFVSMPTSSTVTVSTVALAMASTNLSGVFIQTLTVIALAKTTAHQTPVVLIVTHAAPTVAGSPVGADHPLLVSAELLALLVGEVAVLLELAGISVPAFIALTHPTVAVATIIANFPVVCATDPVVALTARTIEFSWICGLANADATVTFAPPTADLAIRCPTAAQGRLRGQLAHTTHLAHRL